MRTGAALAACLGIVVPLLLLSEGCGGDDAGDQSLATDASADTTLESSSASDASDASRFTDAADGSGGPVFPQRGCPVDAGTSCYTVYAQTDTTLYYLDLATAALVTVGAFDAEFPDGGADTITDLAVAPDDVIWAASKTALYRADSLTGHASFVGLLTCGAGTIGLTADTAGTLYLGDSNGAMCKVDPTALPLSATTIGSMSNQLALGGDWITVGATTYAATFSLANPTSINNATLATVNLTTAQTTPYGSATGFPKLFGVAYGGHFVLGFTSDGTTRVAQIDPVTGTGTQYFFDTSDAGSGLTFTGAGVNPLVTP